MENFIANYANVIEPEQITPLEYVIVKRLTEPKSIETISAEIMAPIDITKNALNRLFGKGMCLVDKDSKIRINSRKKDLFDQQLIKPVFPLN